MKPNRTLNISFYRIQTVYPSSLKRVFYFTENPSALDSNTPEKPSAGLNHEKHISSFTDTHTHIPPNTPQRSNTTQKRPEIPKPRKSCRCIFLAKMLFSRGEKIFCTPELHHKCLYRRRSFERRSQGHGQDLHLVQGFTLETINICYTTPSSQRLAWTNNLPCACVDMKTWTDATVLSKKKREHS